MTESEAYEQGQQDGPVRAGDARAFFSEPYGDLSLRLGRRQIDIERRWEAASILNDILIGLWFVAGSVLNLLAVSETAALLLYLLGSVQLLIRPFMRLARRTHVRGMQSRSRPRIYRPDRDEPGSQGDEHR